MVQTLGNSLAGIANEWTTGRGGLDALQSGNAGIVRQPVLQTSQQPLQRPQDSTPPISNRFAAMRGYSPEAVQQAQMMQQQMMQQQMMQYPQQVRQAQAMQYLQQVRQAQMMQQAPMILGLNPVASNILSHITGGYGGMNPCNMFNPFVNPFINSFAAMPFMQRAF